MPIFGSKEIFAIETTPIFRHKVFFIWFWSRNISIGDPLVPVTVTGPINWTIDFLKHKKERYLPNSYKLTKEQLMYGLYEFEVCSDEFLSKIPSIEKFELISDASIGKKYHTIVSLQSIGMEAFFDSIHIILIDEYEKNRQRLIWRNFSDMSLHESFLPAEYFDKVALTMLTHFTQVLPAEIHKIPPSIFEN